MNPEISRIEDEARMQELRELFALLEEKELHTASHDEEFHSVRRALSVLSWCDFEENDRVSNSVPAPTFVRVHQIWLKALHYVMSYLRLLLLPSEDASLLSKFKQVLMKYKDIKYPNLLIVIQPKLQLINTIEA